MDILDLLRSLSAGTTDANTGKTLLVAGLGNPEPRYEGTRHNVGFDAADALCKAYGGRFKKSRHHGEEAEITVDGNRVIVLKPDTYMNRSGVAVQSAAAFYKVDPARIVIFCDDVSLAPGVLRVRERGSAGGHNGLKSIIEHLASEEFVRVRIGVGNKAHPDMDLADHVLGKPSEEDRALIADAVGRAVETIPYILRGEAAEAQSRLCRKKDAPQKKDKAL